MCGVLENKKEAFTPIFSENATFYSLGHHKMLCSPHFFKVVKKEEVLKDTSILEDLLVKNTNSRQVNNASLRIDFLFPHYGCDFYHVSRQDDIKCISLNFTVYASEIISNNIKMKNS